MPVSDGINAHAKLDLPAPHSMFPAQILTSNPLCISRLSGNDFLVIACWRYLTLLANVIHIALQVLCVHFIIRKTRDSRPLNKSC